MMTRIVTVIDDNLFAIAARELGDAMQWANLAQVNRLSDPFLAGQITLRIPQPNSAFSDGIGEL